MKQPNLGIDAFFFVIFKQCLFEKSNIHQPSPHYSRVTLFLMGENSLLKVDFL